MKISTEEKVLILIILACLLTILTIICFCGTSEVLIQKLTFCWLAALIIVAVSSDPYVKGG